MTKSKLSKLVLLGWIMLAVACADPQGGKGDKNPNKETKATDKSQDAKDKPATATSAAGSGSGDDGAGAYLWRDIVSGTKSIDAGNETIKKQIVSVSLSEFGFLDTAGGEVKNSVAGLAAMPPKPQSLDPGAMLRIRLKSSSPDALIRPGKYTALVLTTVDGKPKAGKVSIVIPAAHPLTGEDLQTEATRWVPFVDDWSADLKVPLEAEVPADRTGINPGPLGVLKRVNGPGYVIASWYPPTPKEKISALPLTLSKIVDAGTYKGTLAFPDGKSATVSIITSDYVIYPAIAIFLGIVLGSLVKRWMNVGRLVYVFKRDVSNLRVAFGRKQEEFSQLVGNKEYRNYTISAAVESACAALLASVPVFKLSTQALDKSNTEYQAALAKLNDLRTTVNSWTDFAKDLRTLDNNMSAVKYHVTNPIHQLQPPPNSQQPAIVQKETLLAPTAQTGVLSLDQYAAVRADVQSATALTATFVKLIVSIETAADLARTLQAVQNQMSAQHQGLFGNANPQQPFTLLWNANDSGEFTRVQTMLDRNSATLEYLRQTYQPQAAMKRDVKEAKALQDFVPIAPDDKPQTEVAKYNLSIQLGDWLAFGVALVGGVLTGLKANYVGQAFGSISDYMNVFLWGLGSKAVVDVASLGLDKAAQALKSSPTPKS